MHSTSRVCVTSLASEWARWSWPLPTLIIITDEASPKKLPRTIRHGSMVAASDLPPRLSVCRSIWLVSQVELSLTDQRSTKRVCLNNQPSYDNVPAS